MVAEGYETAMGMLEYPGFAVHNAMPLNMPVLISVPHAGRDYPDEIFASLRLPPASLLRLEDRYADLLIRDVVSDGAPTIIAHRARAWIDLNRDERDIDVEMVSGLNRHDYPAASEKQRGGLGLIPRRLAGEGDIWMRQLTVADVDARIACYHRPYHTQIAKTLRQMRQKFGVAILLDLHSMPPIRDRVSNPVPQFVIGDRFGRSASSRFAELLSAQIRAYGYHAALNHPYSGDYILRRHAAAGRNIHALQIEVDRSLYLDSALREPGAGVARIGRLVADIVAKLADEALGYPTLIAAE